MPPLPPNVTKAGLLRSKSGWNNSSLSRRSNTTRGLLSTRVPQSLGTTGGGVPNPSLGIGTIKEAMPKNAAGSWRPWRPTNPADSLTTFTTLVGTRFNALLQGEISGYDVHQAIQANGYTDITSIKHVDFGNEITSIRAEVVDGYTWFGLFKFGDNTSVTRITFKPGSQLTEFGTQAIANLNKLEYLEIPPLVTSLGTYTLAATGVHLQPGDIIRVIVKPRAAGISVRNDTYTNGFLKEAAFNGNTLESYESRFMPANGVVNEYTYTVV